MCESRSWNTGESVSNMTWFSVQRWVNIYYWQVTSVSLNVLACIYKLAVWSWVRVSQKSSRRKTRSKFRYQLLTLPYIGFQPPGESKYVWGKKQKKVPGRNLIATSFSSYTSNIWRGKSIALWISCYYYLSKEVGSNHMINIINLFACIWMEYATSQFLEIMSLIILSKRQPCVRFNLSLIWIPTFVNISPKK